jgi:DNA-binding Lrp family transcriptional regulator
LADISDKTGLAISTVHKRINKLLNEKYIDRFTVLLNPDRFGCATAFLLVDVDSERIKEVVEKLKNDENILEIYESLGSHNLVLKIRASTLERLKEAVNKVSDTEGVYSFEFYLATTRYKENAWKPEVDSI